MTFQVGVLVLAVAAAHASARPPAPKPDACHVLTRREVAAVQGEAFSGAKVTSRGEVSQCFYQLPTFSKSVSVDVVRDDGREFWEERFGRDDDEREATMKSTEHVSREEEEEREQKGRQVRVVSGVGDEAFWAGSPAGGSLYVRKGDSVLRVSVGGPGTDEQKLARSKKLALKALRRL